MVDIALTPLSPSLNNCLPPTGGELYTLNCYGSVEVYSCGLSVQAAPGTVPSPRPVPASGRGAAGIPADDNWVLLILFLI